jgi:DNA-binding CsgD family transcriptional regulator
MQLPTHRMALNLNSHPGTQGSMSDSRSALDRSLGEAANPAAYDGLASGVLLCDADLNLIGSDAGAQIIFGHQGAGGNGHATPFLPTLILEQMRAGRAQTPIAETLSIQIGQHSYRCRLYPIQTTHAELAPALIAVHLDPAPVHDNDPVDRIIAEYRLTLREIQALRGIALGLTTKELAHRMQISPNTVKSFIRLITVKMGVSSRAEIMVRLLRSSQENRT